MPVSIPITVCRIDEDGFHLTIDAKINGRKALLLIDTGASRSVFDLNRINRFSENEYTTTESLSTGLGTNTMQSHQIVLENISFGELVLKNFETVLLDLSHVNGSYLNMKLPAIDGVLGSDVLMKHKAVIDFKKQVLKLNKR